MSIASLLEPGRVLCNVEARSKKHALEILSELLASAGNDLSASEIFGSLVSRERLGSTGLGDGVAIPHGRVPGISTSIGAFIKLSDTVDFESTDGKPVSLVFGILVPEECSDEHLEDLAAIAKLFSHEEFREGLKEVTSSRDLYELLIRLEPPRETSD